MVHLFLFFFFSSIFCSLWLYSVSYPSIICSKLWISLFHTFFCFSYFWYFPLSISHFTNLLTLYSFYIFQYVHLSHVLHINSHISLPYRNVDITLQSITLFLVLNVLLNPLLFYLVSVKYLSTFPMHIRISVYYF